MGSKLVDDHDEEGKFRLDAKTIRVAVDGTKYDVPFRCAVCGDPFIYKSEVWGLIPDNGPPPDFVHYDCEVARK